MDHRRERLTLLATAVAAACYIQWPLPLRAQRVHPTFRTGVALVPITAVVRDSRNRIVRSLGREDFRVLEEGSPRPLVDFKVTDRGPVSVALLLDTSGSMRVGSSLEKATAAIQHLLSWIQPEVDDVALFTFDKALRQDVPFTRNPEDIRVGLDRVRPYGLTSLYDAIAETAKCLNGRPYQRRAVVVVTDGADTSSTRTLAEVSGLASAIDVPVYVFAVVSAADRQSRSPATDGPADGDLSNLASWTGGYLTYVSLPTETSSASRELIEELRHQYVLAIESAAAAGWYRLEVKTTRPGLRVRARSGYFASAPASVGSMAPGVVTAPDVAPAWHGSQRRLRLTRVR